LRVQAKTPSIALPARSWAIVGVCSTVATGSS
jgi:hypothetical protein